MSHAITLTSTLGETLRFANMSATEELGRLSTFRIEAISKNASVDLRALLGSPMTVTVTTPQGYVRYYNGIVAEAEQGAFVQIENVRYAVYTFAVVPKPWLLRQTLDCRIYKNKTVPQIVREVLSEFGYGDVRLSLTANYSPREYCVQYRESYFDFISRLMEQEGIYYYFTHAAGSHTMVLADALGAHSTVATFETIPYAPPTERGHRMKASISDWTTGRTVNPTRVRLDDYDYQRPRASLLANEQVTDSADAHGVSGLEIYDYPYGSVGYAQALADGQRYAQVRADALNVPQATSSGVTDAVGLTTGALFRFKDFPLAEANQEYLVVAATTRLVEVDYQGGGVEPDQDEAPFACHFRVIRSRQPFRSEQTTAWPVIAGVQTAVVYGQTDEDIEVDSAGRVQVTFFWNPSSKPKSDQSCPVRVASSWSGKRWGAQFIPRVGQEVIVGFHDGNPDRPLILGSVYNQEHMPPHALPGDRTRSGVVSRSLLGASGEANEIRFEDRKGAEELLFHAQRDLRHEAENDHVTTIDRDETETIKRDRSHDIGRDDTLKVGRRLRIEAGEEIELVTGLARILMKRTGEIQITGSRLALNGAATINLVSGGATSLTSGAAVSVTAGATVTVNATAAIAVTSGAALMLSSTLGPAVLKGMPPLLL
ncbi:type IV secretion protein Rhs [Luteibacter rhizovicinus DSM 16549]|uniref:Type IV secretion protein Rhs n=1 Tax=Luteibacter rhizovicinus DSM 16549 TaxID=1440763 RepID=A0A0G9HBJ8_9GAMM|nr:type VI secretion system tip protein TssI/VgrG [Luteibacter rhizovicinus]APG05591.1 type IV secretion protein Rhs [Luteibacter rhizovicinus DSM 16549]KLD67018.1 type IV secretion protein Rhs [Luteibacter rhizovicinus DSM 16549]KLD78318.1 type IV secretion protein Rhs [Xanthomonas hyacinthi DSM 19077]